MSDPVKNADIEDVLSSIRRLVSTNERGAPTPDAREEDEADKLVLTPSQRVSDASPAAQPDADASEVEAAIEDALAPPRDEAREDNTAEGAAAQTENAAEDTSPDSAASPPEPAEDSTEEDDIRMDDIWTNHPAEDDIALEFRATPDDGGPVDDTWTEDTDAAAGADDATADTGAAQVPESRAHEWAETAADESGTGDLSARAAGFEEAVAAVEDNWEPDGEGEDDNAARPVTDVLPWEDAEGGEESAEDAEDETATAAEADVSPTEGLEPFEPDEDEDETAAESTASAPQAEPRDNAFLAEEDPLGDDATILDEDALRDLVTEIVRQELQGALGERITRNVRKLVRREIHRALTAQELE